MQIIDHSYHQRITTVNDNPRCVEIVRDYISAKQTDSLIVNREFVEGLYEHLNSQIELRYPMTFDCPSDQLFGALIFGDFIASDNESLECITCSIITNSIDRFGRWGKDVGVEWPESSLAIMRYVTSRGKTGLAKAISGGITAIIGHVTVDGGEEYIRKEAYCEWMKIRLAAMCKFVPYKNVHSNPNVMNIMKLFGITRGATLPDMHWKILSAPLRFPDVGDTYWTEHHLTNNGYKKPTLFLKEIDNIELSALFPIAILRPSKGDAFDLCLKILVPGYDEPIHIFVDNKAIDETKDSADKVPYNVNDSGESK